MTLTFLDHSTAGTYKITTEGAYYYIDFDLRLFQRISKDEDHRFRRDGEHMPLLEFDDIEIGMPMVIWTNMIHDDKTITARLTTTVQQIEYINE